MTHDSLCPGIYELEGLSHSEPGFVRNCQCVFIAKVRDDERAATFRDVIQAVSQTLEDVKKAIEGLTRE